MHHFDIASVFVHHIRLLAGECEADAPLVFALDFGRFITDIVVKIDDNRHFGELFKICRTYLGGAISPNALVMVGGTSPSGKGKLPGSMAAIPLMLSGALMPANQPAMPPCEWVTSTPSPTRSNRALRPSEITPASKALVFGVIWRKNWFRLAASCEKAMPLKNFGYSPIRNWANQN